ncbi:lysophospholipid acyltransferase family protein [Spiroplasma alleghenense]|uniref:1-acyl-sn-glycerol-3-phosphate acyltransferase n=1 Tax=Spiroplasma alleghenense TaxID=216931 RepID=A0A345Z3U8_9MOLU|nr:lysophospholipid acyltransferase family protein [Spiroplasma alleghenense]AXK51277.1 1-acyl-sn-glycerol-3-phosphate acyltransferase [Spiroplasma alleghenense]
MKEKYELEKQEVTNQEEVKTEKKAKDQKKERGSTNFNKWKLLLIWVIVLMNMSKAKKMARRIKKDPNSYSEEYRYYWVKKIARRMMWLLDVKIQVIDIENWLDRGIILAPNHQSNFDSVALIALNDFSRQQPLAFIAKQELWDHKTFGRFIKLIDAIPLDRGNPRSALNAYKEGKELLNQYHRSLVIFPEGTRSPDQEIGEFQGASMKIAQSAYVPIVPVTIIDSHYVFAKKRPKKVVVKVVFGKPLLPEKFISIKTDILTNNVRKEVVKNMEKYKDFEKIETKKKRKEKK